MKDFDFKHLRENKMKCDKCNSEMEYFIQGSCQGWKCIKCSEMIVTTYIDPIEEDKTKYKITFPKLPDCYIKLVRFVSDRNKCNLHIAKEMLRNGIIIEDIPAKEVKEILLLCKNLGVEPVVSPNFPHKVD